MAGSFFNVEKLPEVGSDKLIVVIKYFSPLILGPQGA
jgi:hypothetical protein